MARKRKRKTPTKRRTAKRRKTRKSKGHVPLKILERRLTKLRAIVKKRGGKVAA